MGNLNNSLSGFSGLWGRKKSSEKPLMNADGTVDVSAAQSNPDSLNAAITRSEWSDYMNRYAPVEKEVMDGIKNFDYKTAGDKAGAEVAASYDNQAGRNSRQLRSLGAALSGEEKKALTVREGIQKSAATAGAETYARTANKQTNDGLMQGMIRMGRESVSTAAGGSAAAAGMANSREIAHRQAMAAYKANKTNNIAGFAGSIIGSL